METINQTNSKNPTAHLLTVDEFARIAYHILGHIRNTYKIKLKLYTGISTRKQLSDRTKGFHKKTCKIIFN